MTQAHVPVDRRFAKPSEEELRDYDYQRYLGNYYSKQTISWDDILACKRAIILGEGRSGKTHEFRRQAALLRAKGQYSVFIPLERLHDSSIEDAISPSDEAALNVWLSLQSEEAAWFFLDAVDELKLRDGSFRTALRKLGRKIEGKSTLAHLIVSCRPADWRHQIDATDFNELFPLAAEKEVAVAPSPEEFFRSTLTRGEFEDQNQKSEETVEAAEPLSVYALLPLTPTQIIDFAEALDPVSAKGLKEEIDKTETWPLFQTPSDIIDGIALLRTKGRLGSLEEQKSAGIALKLGERPDRPGSPKLSPTRALQGAERLALALTLTRRRSLQVDRTAQSETALCVADVLTDWTEPEWKELLSRPLFDPSGVNSVRFHHRSTAEFLAAKRLSTKLKDGLRWRELRPLLFSDLWGERVIRPYAEPIAAWLALWREEVLAEVRARKPQILFQQGLPHSMPIGIREDLLTAFVDKYSDSDWRGIGVNVQDVERLGHTELESKIRLLWEQAKTGSDAFKLLLRLVLFTPIPECADLGFEVALDNEADHQHRVYAARIVFELGATKEKRRLGAALLAGGWGDDLVRTLIPYLLPDAVDPSDFVELARQTEEASNTVHGLGYSLHTALRIPELSAPAVRDLTHALAVSIWEDRLEGAKSYEAHSKYDHFTDAALAGCAREAELPTSQLPDDWVWDAMIALHFGERKQSIIAEKETKVVVDRLASDPLLRSRFFWATLELSITLDNEKDAWSRYHSTDYENYLGAITEGDYPWLFEALEDQSHVERRGVAFYAIMLFWQSERDSKVAERVRRAIADSPDLIAEYDRFINPPKSSPNDRFERRNAKQRKKWERKEATRVAQWERWRLELEDDPVAAFSGDAKEQNLYDFFNWMKMATRSLTSWGGWSEDALRGTFSDALIEQLRPALSEFWRQDDPKTWSEKEEKNRTSSQSIDALSALKSETSTESWADQLSADEATLATKLSMIELNGFADLLPELVRSHTVEVRHVFTEELKAQIENLRETENAPLLHDLQYSDAAVLKAAVARWLLDAFDLFPTEFSDGTSEALVRAVDLVVGFTEPEERQDVVSLVQRRLAECHPLSAEQAAWLRAFAVLDPQAGCVRLVEVLREHHSPEEIEFGYTLLGRIFGDRDHSGAKPELSRVPEDERANLLASLVETAYRVAHPATDLKHTKVYSPGRRDYAENARRYLFDRLVELKCLETYQALGRFSALPEFDHMKSRLLEMRTELAAAASEPEPMATNHVNRFDQTGSLTPANTEMLHETMLNRLSDYEHFLLHSEFSNRNTVRLVEQETELRRNISGWLHDHSRDAYRVNQEAVKINENRTDIRLSATTVDLEAVIELKLDDSKHRWSGADLEAALRDQLVGKYLSHERCRSGCLLIVQREKRRWQRPSSGQLMDFPELIAWLQDLATQIVTERPEIMVSVVGIDLTE
ncbi:MAG: hypothetical protein AAF376_03500 [Pseudomonadota bacterium]